MTSTGWRGKLGREDHIAAAYRELGFANPVCVGYQSSLNTPADRAGCAFAQKTLVQQGRRTTIIAAMLRGVGYGAEWVSNLHLGENSWHYGFVTAAEQFFADLQDYLACAKAQPESWAPSNCGWAATAAARQWQIWPPPGCAGSCRRSRRRTPMCTPLQPRRH